MFIKSPTSRRLSALATAALLSVALPTLPALAKEKAKTKPAAETSVDYSVSIPSIEAVDSNVDDATLTEIFSGNLVEHADALAGLTATSITVPEITVTAAGQQGDDAYSGSVTFTDLVLQDVVDGVAASVSLAGTDMTTEEAGIAFGQISAANFDIGGVLGIYGLVDNAGQTELETIYTDFAAEGGAMTSEEIDCTIGPVSGAEFKARPLRTSLVEFVAMAQNLEEEDPEELEPGVIGTMMRMYADIFTAFETSEVTFGGMSCEGVDEEGEEISFGLAGMTMGAMSPGIYPSISMDGFTFSSVDDATMSLDNFTVKPMDLSSAIATLESVPDNVDDAWFEANMRGLMPAMEGVSLSGFSMDLPDEEHAGARIKAQVGAFDLSLANYLNGIPTNAEMSAQNIVAEIPENTGDESLDQLRGLGVTDIDAGFRIALAWDEASSTIDIEEVSVTGVDLATVTLAGTIANATADLFDVDPDLSLAAAMGIAVKSFNVDVVDDGLTEIMLGAIAADQGGTVEQLRPLYADLAKGTVIGILAGVADAAKVGDAISTFIAGKARTLNIALEAKEEPGLGMLDFMAAESDPTAILRKVNISASTK